MKNQPYIKSYNELGEVANPINEAYNHGFPNRERRRQFLQKQPFMGNGHQTPITVSGTVRYLRSVQSVFKKVFESDKFGRLVSKMEFQKRINHYTLIK